MKYITTIKNILKYNKRTNAEMHKEWETHQNYIKTLQEDYKLTNPSRLAIGLVKPNSRVLSCGCGAGREVKYLVSIGCEVVAIDNSLKMLKLSKMNEPNAFYKLVDMITYKEEKRFDYIICLWNTINHLKDLEERKQFIKTCKYNLKDGGNLIIITKHKYTNIASFVRSVLSNKDYYFSPKQIDYWFKNMSMVVSKVNIANNVLIVGEKQ